MDVVWDGVTRPEVLREAAIATRRALADAARDAAWPRVFELLSKDTRLVNCSRPGGSSHYAPLHQAAHCGAPLEVAQRLLELGAWRTLQNARGERPVDVAERLGHGHLVAVLTPEPRHRVPLGVLLKIQAHFHRVIRARIDEPLPDHALRLPELEPLLELDEPQMWFAVPGMYGGFSFRLAAGGVDAMLVSESWCRVVEGSEQRHEIDSRGSRLVVDRPA